MDERQQAQIEADFHAQAALHQRDEAVQELSEALSAVAQAIELNATPELHQALTALHSSTAKLDDAFQRR
jgi:uncharacterized protein YukE